MNGPKITYNQGEDCGTSKISTEQAKMIKKLLKVHNIADTARIMGVNIATVRHIYYGETWKWLRG